MFNIFHVHFNGHLHNFFGKIFTQILVFLYSMFIYLFLTVLSLYHCTGFSLVADSRGYILVAERELLLAVASLVVEHGLWGTWASVVWLLGSVVVVPGFHSMGSVVHYSMWDLPRPGIKYMSLPVFECIHVS